MEPGAWSLEVDTKRMPELLFPFPTIVSKVTLGKY